MDRFHSSNNMSGNDLGAMQMLLNQVKMLQDQVTSLQSNKSTHPNVGRDALVEVPVQPMPNVEMDLKAKMASMLQGLSTDTVQPLPNVEMDLKAKMASMLQGMGGDARMSAMLQGMNGNANMDGRSACIWVSGIPEDYADTKILCNIFGNYGNVVKIVFSKKKPDGALIELEEAMYASNCCKYLHNTKLGSARISVRPSKIEHINDIRSNDNKARDFSNDRFQRRFRDSTSKFTQIILSRLSEPTPVLCISNIPEGMVSEVKDYIVEKGFDVKKIQEGKKRSNDKEEDQRKVTFAFVEFASTQEAIGAMGKLHKTMPTEKATNQEGKKFNRGLTFSFTSKTSC